MDPSKLTEWVKLPPRYLIPIGVLLGVLLWATPLVNGDTMLGPIVLSVCGGLYGVFLLAAIVAAIASWRTTRRLGRRVDRWSDDAARMLALLEAGASPTVAEQLVQGNKINAIKACRIETGLGLTEAKHLVDRYESALYRYEPWDTRTAR